MRTKEIRILVYEYSNIEELPEADQELVLNARETSKDAYAPYSNFHVGAAILLEDGKIITGNNQENSAYPSGLCAERVALFHANANFPDKKVNVLAVTANNKKGLVLDPVTPCGACRQAILEAEMRFKQPIKIILDGQKKIQVLEGVESLLPLSFKLE